MRQIANKTYTFTSINGGSGSLKSKDGADLLDKDAAIVGGDGHGRRWELDDDSAATESLPHIIAATANGGNKRWILKSGFEYYVDASAVNQAATTNPESIASLLAAIGTSKKATIVLDHTSSGNTTTYTIGQNADWSAYTNVTFKIVSGALLQIADGVTVTFGGPVDIGLHTAFTRTTTGTVVFGSGSVERVVAQWFGAVADNTTNAGPAFTWAVTVANASSSPLYAPGSFKITSSVPIPVKVQITGAGEGTDATAGLTRINFAGTFTGFAITVSGVKLSKMTLYQSSGNVRGISLTGASHVMEINHCQLDDFTNHAIYTDFIVDLRIIDCKGRGPYSALGDSPGATTTRTSDFLHIEPADLATVVTIERTWVTWWRYGVNILNGNNVTVLGNIFESNYIAIYAPADYGIGTAGFWLVDYNWFENNYNTSYGGGYFNTIADPTNILKMTRGMIGRNNYQYLLAGRDKMVGGGMYEDFSASPVVATAGIKLTKTYVYDGTAASPVVHTVTSEAAFVEKPVWKNEVSSRPAGNSARASIQQSLLDSSNNRWIHEWDADGTGSVISVYDEDVTATKGTITIKNLVINSGATAERPPSPTNGMIFYDTTLVKLIFWNGSAWVNLNGSAL